MLRFRLWGGQSTTYVFHCVLFYPDILLQHWHFVWESLAAALFFSMTIRCFLDGIAWWIKIRWYSFDITGWNAASIVFYRCPYTLVLCTYGKTFDPTILEFGFITSSDLFLLGQTLLSASLLLTQHVALGIRVCRFWCQMQPQRDLSPPVLKPGISGLIDECVTHYTVCLLWSTI